MSKIVREVLGLAELLEAHTPPFGRESQPVPISFEPVAKGAERIGIGNFEDQKTAATPEAAWIDPAKTCSDTSSKKMAMACNSVARSTGPSLHLEQLSEAESDWSASPRSCALASEVQPWFPRALDRSARR